MTVSNLHYKRSNVLYINVVRDPIDRFVSAFYFAQNGDVSGIGPHKTNETNITIDEYVKKSLDLHEDIRRPLSYFFLSDASEDEERNVQIAKRNIEKYFSLVGISEQMDHVTILLQKLFPDLLSGLNNIYRNKNAKMAKATSTIGKVPPSPETVAILKNKLRHDYDLYEYIKKRFYDLRNQFRRKTP
ncbi:Uronyl 2-sulfotransferase [Holothuria leucospilota]|uniref:Uronyl 2-sulfotransferase n=1 Tax=Holothuria leucospilota TaxID=206669 RepID=A0A9Q1BYF6_HOLLE|nr:Uronyl 2-sulfotransferase [Holothuria leucospilota]